MLLKLIKPVCAEPAVDKTNRELMQVRGLSLLKNTF